METESNQRLSLANIEILSIPAPIPNRNNEDAWLALETAEPPGLLIAAVIDGAGARLSLPPLKAMLEQDYHGLTPAAFAATCVRTSLLSQFATHPNQPLDTALLTANQALRSAVVDSLGDFSPGHILALAGLPPDSDPRHMRLALPACVVTLIRLDWANQRLEYAHAGDTSLLEIRRDGEVIRHTPDQMGPYDQGALRLAARLRQAKGLPHIVDAVRLPEVQETNIENGLRHNYVDNQGLTHPGEGCGVINGLPELADYLEFGMLSVDPGHTEGFCLLSDGLELLARLEETVAQMENRLRNTGTILRTRGLPGLYETVCEMAKSDTHFDQYPRMKAQDDATGIYLRLSNGNGPV
jgi:hypothetical protein